jgi:hypothetical protein
VEISGRAWNDTCINLSVQCLPYNLPLLYERAVIRRIAQLTSLHLDYTFRTMHYVSYYYSIKIKVNEAEGACMVSCFRANKETGALFAHQQPIRPGLSSEMGMGDLVAEVM